MNHVLIFIKFFCSSSMCMYLLPMTLGKKIKNCTVEPRYNKVLGTMNITLLYQVSHYIRVQTQRNIKSWDQRNYLVVRGFCYIRPLYNEVPLYWRNGPLKNRVGRSVIFFFFLPSSMPIYTHIPCVHIHKT